MNKETIAKTNVAKVATSTQESVATTENVNGVGAVDEKFKKQVSKTTSSSTTTKSAPGESSKKLATTKESEEISTSMTASSEVVDASSAGGKKRKSKHKQKQTSTSADSEQSSTTTDSVEQKQTIASAAQKEKRVAAAWGEAAVGGDEVVGKYALQGVQPVTVALDDFSSIAVVSEKADTACKNVSCFASPGTITAFMGFSRVGMTSVMDTITGRQDAASGKVLLNGHLASSQVLRRHVGYCERTSVHWETSTVREVLTMSVLLRQSAVMTANQKLALAEDWVRLLQLQTLADKLVRELSTEQLVRVKIGAELVAGHSVLVLDEPMWGLDAASALSIMELLRRIATTGRTLILTDRQPSTRVFYQFDRLVLLTHSGELVFNGDIGADAQHVIRHFHSSAGVKKFTAGANPATWVLECVNSQSTQSSKHGAKFVKHYNQSELKRTMTLQMNRHGVLRPSRDLPQLTCDGAIRADSYTQMSLLLQRFVHSYWRLTSFLWARFTIGMLLLVWIIKFMTLQSSEFDTLDAVNGGFWVIAISTFLMGVLSFGSVVPAASREASRFEREQHLTMYQPLWYSVAATVADASVAFSSSLVYTFILFVVVGFADWSSYSLYWVCLSVFVLLQICFGRLTAYVTRKWSMALIIGGGLSLLAMLQWASQRSSEIFSYGYAIANLSVIVFSSSERLRFAPAALSRTALTPPLMCWAESWLNIYDTCPRRVADVSVKSYVSAALGATEDSVMYTIGFFLVFVLVLRFLTAYALRLRK